MRTSESIIELTKALVVARKAFAPVRRESTAQVGSSRTYSYADLSTILEATMPALLEQGLMVLQAVDAETSTLITRLAHTSGEWVESAYPLKLDQAPQQLGSALTYGRRYSLQSILCLAAEDDDGASAQSTSTSKRTREGSEPSTRKRATVEGPQPTRRPDVTPSPTPAERVITPLQQKRLWTVASKCGWSKDEVREWLIAELHVTSSAQIPKHRYDAIIRHLEQGPAPATLTADDIPF